VPNITLPPELLKPITTEAEYDAAVTKLNELLDIEQAREHTAEESDYLNTLGAVIEEWDEAHPIDGGSNADV